MKNILIIAAAQTVLILVAVAGTWFMFLYTLPAQGVEEVAAEEKAAPAKPKTPAQYFSIDPALVVNLQGDGKMRFLQVQLEVMTREDNVSELLTTHNTRIRNALIFQLGSLSVEELRQPDGKARIQDNAKMAINKVLKEEVGAKDPIEAVYFTKFVIQ